MSDPEFSKTETAIRAFVAALDAVALAEGGAILPRPTRNLDLVGRLAAGVETEGVAGADEVARHLNVIDGDRADPEELAGADLGAFASYDIVWNVRVEWIVAGGDDAARESIFDLGRRAIWNAVKAVVDAGAVSYLGGAVDGVRLVGMLPHDRSTLAGLPGLKSTEMVFALTFTSADPF